MKINFLPVKILLAIILISTKAMSQGNPGGGGNVSLPDVVPLSPQAASFMKDINYEVSLYNGLPDITIPLYTIQEGKISVPISLTYGASGIKVDQENGDAGIGWSISSDFRITRRIFGKADDQFSFPHNFTAFPTDPSTTDFNYAYFNSIYKISSDSTDNYDSQYDIFTFRLCSEQGNFILLNGPGNTKTSAFINYSPSKIKFTRKYNQPTTGIDHFDILDGNGVLHRFGRSLSGNTDETEAFGLGSPIQSWYLTDMVAPDQIHKIQFSYTARPNAGATLIFPQSIILDDYVIGSQVDQGGSQPTCPLASPYPGGASPMNHPSNGSYDSKELSGITFTTGNVMFYRNSLGRIDSIKVSAANGSVIKIIRFYRSFFPGSPHEKLDSLSIVGGAGNTPGQTYKFTYSRSMGASRFDQDFWGYYNAAGNNQLVPQWNNISVTTCLLGQNSAPQLKSVGFANRQPTQDGADELLTKITYPTGGNTTYNYELNRFYNTVSGQVQPGGGFRVASISSFDGIGNTLLKYYHYGVNESGYGNGVAPDISIYKQDGIVLHRGGDGQYTYRERVFLSDPVVDLAPIMNSAVTYNEVAEYSENQGGTSLGKTVYKFENLLNTQFETTSMYPQNSNSSYQPQLFYQSSLNPANKLVLREKDIYKQKSDGSFQVIEKDSTIYGSRGISSVTGLSLAKYASSPEGDMSLIQASNLFYQNVSVFAFGPSVVYYGASLHPDKEIDNLSLDTQYPLSIQKNYTYNSYDNPTQEQDNTSDGGTITKNYLYPSDFAGTAAYDTLVNRNIVSPVIEQKEYKNALLTSLNKTNYNIFDPPTANFVLPATIQVQNGSGPLEYRVNFDGYDTHGNILQQHLTNDANRCYQWGYNKTYPVAQVINAKSNDVFYDSFEEGDGNSTTGDSRTGHLSHIGSYSKSLTGLDASNYTLSYWLKSPTTGVWLLTTVSETITGTTFTISLSGQIDDVRIYPSTAQMTTYTYDPLVGMTSSTDAKNQTTYYEYDSFQRLMNIKDKDGNIVKHYDYHYQGQ